MPQVFCWSLGRKMARLDLENGVLSLAFRHPTQHLLFQPNKDTAHQPRHLKKPYRFVAKHCCQRVMLNNIKKKK